VRRVTPKPAKRKPVASNLPVLPLLGRSPAMARIAALIERISRFKTNVLLLGESGTGKDLLARTIHARGPRRGHRFEPQNCATLGRELLESELFGHERGSFTGAHAQKTGLFELAHGGTLFLDEIGELDLSTQAKLLRVLEHNRFRRLGGTDVVTVDVSIIAATNRLLADLVSRRQFRDDLYYRLKVVTIEVPPLRERKEDIVELVAAFIVDFNARHGTRLEGVSRGLMARFQRHDWPGNIRELRNAIESAGVLSTHVVLDEADAEASGFGSLSVSTTQAPGAVTVPPTATLADAERLLLESRLALHGSREAAARSLGLGLRTLYSRLQRLNAER
jgi:transcriptional regulator with PAS, ATPase and Fis domain